MHSWSLILKAFATDSIFGRDNCRQSVKTVAHLIATGFLVAPWLMAGTVVGGWLLGWAAYWFTQKAVVAVLDKYQVHDTPF